MTPHMTLLSERANHDVEAAYTLAFHLYEQGRFSDAACFFRFVLVSVPHDERGWLGLGLCHEGLGQLSVAEEFFSLGLSQCPESEPCLHSLRRVRNELGEPSHDNAMETP